MSSSSQNQRIGKKAIRKMWFVFCFDFQSMFLFSFLFDNFIQEKEDTFPHIHHFKLSTGNMMKQCHKFELLIKINQLNENGKDSKLCKYLSVYDYD